MNEASSDGDQRGCVLAESAIIAGPSWSQSLTYLRLYRHSNLRQNFATFPEFSIMFVTVLEYSTVQTGLLSRIYCVWRGLTNYCCYLVVTVSLAIANTWSSASL